MTLLSKTGHPNYFDLGGNLWSKTQRQVLNVVSILFLLFAIIEGVRRYYLFDSFSNHFSLFCLLLTSAAILYGANRPRSYPLGYRFVKFDGSNLEYRGLEDWKVQSFPLKDIEFIQREGQKIGFKPFNDKWHYIKVDFQVEEIFAQLENLTSKE